MRLLMRLSLAMSLVMAAVWFGGNLFWLWIVSVGLPAGDPDLALVAAGTIENAAGPFALLLVAVLSVAAFGVAAGVSWSDHRSSAAVLLVGCVVGQLALLGIYFGLPVSADQATTWTEYGVHEALVTVLAALVSGLVLALAGLAIWSAARSRFVADF